MAARDLRSLPLLAPLVRALALLAVIEAIFGRLLVPPAAPATGFDRLLEAAGRSGGLAFVPALALVMLSIAAIAIGLLREPRWPAGLNGFIAACLLTLVLLGTAAFGAAISPLLVLGFTSLSLLTFLTIAMHAFATRASPWIGAFAVVYGAALICSALTQVALLAAPDTGGPGAASELFAGWAARRDLARQAGELLLAAAAALAFMAWCNVHPMGGDPRRLRLAIIAAIPAGALFALATMGMGQSQEIAGRAGWWMPALLTGSVFLAAVTSLACLLDPDQRTRGLGILMLLLAGFPLRIAYQQLLMVLGTTLLLAPPASAGAGSPASRSPASRGEVAPVS